MTDSIRALCAECGRESALYRDGTIHLHSDMRKVTGNLPWHPRCAGSGKKPKS